MHHLESNLTVNVSQEGLGQRIDHTGQRDQTVGVEQESRSTPDQNVSPYFNPLISEAYKQAENFNYNLIKNQYDFESENDLRASEINELADTFKQIGKLRYNYSKPNIAQTLEDRF